MDLKKLLLSSSIAGLISCSSTGVIPVDNDSYMIAMKDHTPGRGISISTKADVYKEANEFCAAKGLVVQTLQVNTLPSAPFEFGSTELQFRCVPKGGIAKPLTHESDNVFEFRNR